MAAGGSELIVEGLGAGYAGVPVVTGVSFRLRDGSRLGILGRNGAGKTTTVAAIMGLTDRMGGTIRLDGRAIDADPTFVRARLGLGYVPQGRRMFPSLTVEESLLAAVAGQRAADALDSAWRMFPRLRERRRNASTKLSGGEQQMLSIARALMGKPRLLLLDEPLEGLAPQIRDELMDSIRAMTEELGIGCLLVEQHVDAVLGFAKEFMILENGRPAFLGDADAIHADPDLLNRTIGLEKT
jgi:branched-chain amino acid transport system ATP-binding protein